VCGADDVSTTMVLAPKHSMHNTEPPGVQGLCNLEGSAFCWQLLPAHYCGFGAVSALWGACSAAAAHVVRKWAAILDPQLQQRALQWPGLDCKCARDSVTVSLGQHCVAKKCSSLPALLAADVGAQCNLVLEAIASITSVGVHGHCHKCCTNLADHQVTWCCIGPAQSCAFDFRRCGLLTLPVAFWQSLRWLPSMHDLRRSGSRQVVSSAYALCTGACKTTACAVVADACAVARPMH
jgi:hypothetical protein